LPVTREGALSTVGNADLVREIMGEGAYLEVTAHLEKDPTTFSGYRWSASRGPHLKISSGLTVQARATVESRAPITYLLPLLREASGVYLIRFMWDRRGIKDTPACAGEWICPSYAVKRVSPNSS